MANLDAFTAADFDPKRYINEACATKTSSEEPIDRYLAELEMKLHLAAEDISLHLEDQATRASQRIPATIRELLHIKDDAIAVRGSVGALLTQLERDTAAHPAAITAVGTLEDLDVVKRRMEDACNTLKEAAGLSSLFHMVDDLFAAGDYQRIAESLAGIQRGLSIVGDSVPEFRDGQERLTRLENRFAAAIEAPLSTAFAKQKGEEAVRLADMLSAVGREDAVRRLYTAARMAPLQSLWDSYSQGTPFVSWLGTFYDQVIHTAEAEANWCKTALPGRFPGFVLSLLTAFMGKIDKPYRARLAAALTGATGSVLPLESLEQAQSTTIDFVGGLYSALVATGAMEPPPPPVISTTTTSTTTQQAIIPDAFEPIHRQVLAPIEALLQGYPDRELNYLTAELQEVSSTCAAAAVSAPESATKVLTEAANRGLDSSEVALGRSVRLTAGTALPAISRVLDRVLQQHLVALQAVVQSLRGRISDDPSSLAASEAVLPLLIVGNKVKGRVAALDESLASTAKENIPVLLAGRNAATASSSSTSITAEQQRPTSALSNTTIDSASTTTAAAIEKKDGDVLAALLRLEAQPQLRQQLAAFLSSNSTSNNTAAAAENLPSARAAAMELDRQISELVEDMLSARIRDQMSGVAGLSEWQNRPTGAVALPTFTPYPLQYITSVGEYLMMLPQLLESALGAEEESEEAGQLVADWIDRIALTADQVYQEQLSQLLGLSEQGAAQLGADLEYFTNVLGTLGVAVPPTLAAWQAAAAAGSEDLPVVMGAARESADDHAVGVVLVVAKLRGLKLPA